MKQKLKEHKGITLVALILTIIVLLILAVVAISAVKGDGIISHAKNARSQYSGAQTNEQSTIQGYLDKLEESQLKSKKIKDNLNKVISTGGNITLEDDFGNKIKVPAGFKIITKTETENTDLNYTADNIDVTKGIVVEDGVGNQFVWIPVGTIYTNAEKTESKTITLGRYEFDNFTGALKSPILIQNANEASTQKALGSGFTEDTKENHNSEYKNAIAKNIEDFCKKTILSGGYYIGRYEARTETERKTKTDDLKPVTLKANDYVYNYVTQPQASERCQSMYTNKPFESDLINSYAWDTATIFFQEFGGNNNYAYKGTVNTVFANTGTSGTSYSGTKDTICNVYDMASNCLEWSTETATRENWEDDPWVTRSADYDGLVSADMSSRLGNNCVSPYITNYDSFRPLLYM